MRTASVSMMRGERPLKEGLPAEGTKLRLVYDTYYEHRGQIPLVQEIRALQEICLAGTCRSGGSSVAQFRGQLTLYYGCDFRKLGTGYDTVSLVGELVGSIYVDYLAEAVEARKVEDHKKVLTSW